VISWLNKEANAKHKIIGGVSRVFGNPLSSNTGAYNTSSNHTVPLSKLSMNVTPEYKSPTFTRQPIISRAAYMPGPAKLIPSQPTPSQYVPRAAPTPTPNKQSPLPQRTIRSSSPLN